MAVSSVPQRQVVGEVVDFRAIAALGHGGPVADAAHPLLVGERQRCRGIFQSIEPMDAQIVGAPLHVGRANGLAQHGGQGRHVLVENLILQILRARRNEDATSRKHRRHEVRECLADACASLGDERAAVLEDPSDRQGQAVAGPGAPRIRRTRLRGDRLPARRRDRPVGLVSQRRVQRELPAQGFDVIPYSCERGLIVRRREGASDEAGDRDPSPASRMPRVVTAGVPMRMPLPTMGGFLSNGIAFLLTVMPARPSAASATLPVRPRENTSTSIR